MGSSGGTSEIVESTEELDSMHQCNGFDRCFKSKAGERDGKSHAYQLNDDLSRIIEAIDLRISSRVSSPSRQMGVHMGQKSTLKKPVQGSAIGISESVTLKQALRRLCISQASEMAATKRPSKSMNVTGASEAGAIRKLYASVVVQASELVLPIEGEKGSLVEVSVVSEKSAVSSCKKASESSQVHDAKPSDTISISSPKRVVMDTGSTMKTRIKDIIAPGSTDDGDYGTATEEIRKEGKGNSKNLESGSKSCAKTIKTSASPRLIRPALRKETHIKRKGKQDIAPASQTSSKSCEIKKAGTLPTKAQLGSTKKSATPALSSAKSEVNGNENDIGSTKPHSVPNSSSAGKVVDEKKNESLRPGEKGECSQSSKSSIGDYSSSTSISEDSHNSGYYANGSRPHMSKDVRWVAIHHVAMHHGSLGLKNFKLIKKLGCGDIGTVYLAELTGSGCFFALKVMDIDFLVSRKKMLRAQTEREILQMLDHPFLPTLYAHFTTDNLSCLVMEYCPGGDLHVLRQKQPSRCFTEPEARFYVAEVLLALEYLHMLGVIYRDLKPENILVREDGHIMLSDFDLSLRCKATPTLLRSSSLGSQESVKKLSGPCLESSCMKPLCTQPDWAPVSCFTPRLVSCTVSNSRKPSSDLAGQVSSFPQLVVEPTDARSNSFVGTHEYLAPEIIRGDGHGSSVDWWTLGIFLYELLFGRTPFKGPGHEETLTNVVSYGLSFPESPAVSFHARDLIRGLLAKEPENRLGSVRGAAEIKTHPFFEGLNWALIRCASPPEIPSNYATGNPLVLHKKKEGKCLDFRTNGEDVEFDLF